MNSGKRKNSVENQPWNDPNEKKVEKESINRILPVSFLLGRFFFVLNLSLFYLGIVYRYHIESMMLMKNKARERENNTKLEQNESYT